MARRSGWMAWLVAFAALALVNAAGAQQTAAGDAGAMAQQNSTVTQPGNNMPVWRDVKSGQANYVSIPGREVGVLIQPQARFPGQERMATAGEAWRKFRNGPITVYGGWVLVLVTLAIAAYYLMKGQIRLSEKPTGHMLERFNAMERVAHWSMGISFVVLAVTGMIILFGKHVLLPVIGYTLFAWLTTLSKYLHNFVGPFFLLSTLVFVIMFLRDNVWSNDDANWIAKAGGLISGEHVPSRRFNFGEKTWFWIGVVGLTIVVGVSGVVLLFPNFDQVRTTMQQANAVHSVGALIFIALSLGHIYMGTIGVEGAYQSMRTGYVDETWAKEHHELWYNEHRDGGGRSTAGGAVPVGAAQNVHRSDP